MLVKGYKLSVIRLIYSEDLIYSLVTIVNNIIYLKVVKRVDFKSLTISNK